MNILSTEDQYWDLIIDIAANTINYSLSLHTTISKFYLGMNCRVGRLHKHDPNKVPYNP